MKIFITYLSIAAGIAVQVRADSQVEYAAGVGQRTVNQFDGSAVRDNNRVWIGTFDAGFDVASNANNISNLLNAWNPYGSTTIVSDFGQSGSFYGDSASDQAQFNNQKIYLWFFATDGEQIPAPDFSNVNEYGLFSSTLTKWIFPSVTAIPPGNSQQINTDEINQAYAGRFDPLRIYLSPVVAVPEPSALGLLGLAFPVAALLLRRRRS